MLASDFENVTKYLAKIICGTKYFNHVFAVGGSVRDYVMHRPIKDIDIVINLPNGGIEFANWLYENGYVKGHVVSYPTYGTSMLRLAKFPDYELEFVQTRKEQYKDAESRNPETCYGSLKEDCFRRDLTINALYYNISKQKVSDPTRKGLKDIQKKVLRTSNSDPDIVFNEDPLRILRVLRFYGRYQAEWRISKSTYYSMKKNAERLKIITKERIRDEFSQMITCCKPDVVLRGLIMIGAMDYIIPEYADDYAFLDRVSNINHSNSLCVRLAILLSGFTVKKAENALRKLRYSNEVVNEVCFLIGAYNWVNQLIEANSTVTEVDVRKLEYRCKTDKLFFGVLFMFAALKKEWFTVMFELYSKIEVDGNGMIGYKLPVNGDDVMRKLGIEPSKAVKVVLNLLTEYAFFKPKATREELLELIS